MKNRLYQMVLCWFVVFHPGINLSLAKVSDEPAHKLDSLVGTLQNLSNAPKVDRLNDISWAYRNIAPDSSLKYAAEAHDLALMLDYQAGATQSLNFLGIAYRNKSAYTKAFDLFIRALKSAEISGDEEQICYSMINLGNIYVYQTNFSGGLLYFQEALKKANKLGSKNIAVYCLLNIGRAYDGMGDFVQAANYYDQTRNLRKEIGDEEGYVIAMADLGAMYVSMGEFDEALTVFEEVLGDIKKFDHKGTLAFVYNNLGKIYLSQNQTDLAFKYVRKSLDITTKYGLKNDESQALLTMSQIYERQGDYVNSLNYHKGYVQRKDSIFNEKNTRMIEVLSANYMEEKLEAEKDLLKKQAELDDLLIKRQKSIIYWSVLVSFLFLIIAGLFFLFWNQRRKHSNEITRQNEAALRHNIDLLELNNEKNNLIRILSHDLRAPINNIKSLTQLIQVEMEGRIAANENDSMEHIKSESDRLLTMIRKILDVESIETPKESITAEKVNMKSLLLRVANAYRESALSKKLEIIPVTGKEDVYVGGDEVHLTQVIENLLSNAIKFSQENKKIWASIVTDNSFVRITIKDQGPGLTDDDKTKIFTKFQQLSAKPTGNEESTGLGLSIVKRYTEKMDGKIWYESELGRGTSFIIQFKRVA